MLQETLSGPALQAEHVYAEATAIAASVIPDREKVLVAQENGRYDACVTFRQIQQAAITAVRVSADPVSLVIDT